MSSTNKNISVAVLDDYQSVSQTIADWSRVKERASVTVFQDHLADESEVTARLLPFEVICVMRERTPITRNIIEQLPNLKLIVSTGSRNASIDVDAAKDRGIEIRNTGYFSSPTVELTWSLILASARHIDSENMHIRSGGWQHTIGADLSGKTLGLVGLGNIGRDVAKIGTAFGMKIIAWSQNMTAAKASEVGAQLVSKEALFRNSDFVSLHLVLSERTRGIISGTELKLMKSSARLINTSRGPLIVEKDLIETLTAGQIAGAALDVFDTEPLTIDHPFRKLQNVLATPHIGYVTQGLYERFYKDAVSQIESWLDRTSPAAK